MLFVGVALLVIGHQLWLWARGWRFNVLSPYFLCDLMIFALLGLGSLAVPLPHQSRMEELLFCLYIWSGLIAYYIGLHLRLRFPSLRLPSLALSLARLQHHPRILASILVGGFLLIIALTILQRLRGLGLSLHEMLALSVVHRHAQVAAEGLGALPIIMMYLFNLILLMYLYTLLQQHRFLTAFVIYFVINLSVLLITSTRIPILMNLAIPIAYYHYAIRRINMLLLLLILVGAPLALTFLHGWRGGNPFAWTVSDRLAEEAQVLHSFYHLWQRYLEGEIVLEYGANYYYYSLLVLIPRDLWQAKPQTSFETRWTIHLFGSLVQDGYIAIHTFTPWGEGLVQFGWLGGVINLFFYGIILNFAINFFSKRPHACLVYFFFTVLASTFIRTSIQALLFTTFIYVVGVWFYERWFLRPVGLRRELQLCASS